MDQQLADDLNGYVGDNFWQDVVLQHDIDVEATAFADPTGRSTVVVLRDGTKVEYDESARRWMGMA